MPLPLERVKINDWNGIRRNFNNIETEWDFIPRLIYIGVTAGAPGFQNSWVNFDGGSPPSARHAHFYKDRGRCFLGGVIKTGASGTTAFTLPTGFRPIHQTNNPVEIPVSAAGGIALIIVTLSGTVVPTNSGASAVGTFVFLEGVSFVCK